MEKKADLIAQYKTKLKKGCYQQLTTKLDSKEKNK